MPFLMEILVRASRSCKAGALCASASARRFIAPAKDDSTGRNPSGPAIVVVLVVVIVVEVSLVTKVVIASPLVRIVVVAREVAVAVSVMIGRVVVVVEMTVVVEVVVETAGVIIVDGVDVVILRAYHGIVRPLEVVLTGEVDLGPWRV